MVNRVARDCRLLYQQERDEQHRKAADEIERLEAQMQEQSSFLKPLPPECVPGDVVYTPDWCAKDCVEWFKPAGSILDPCKGGGAFLQYMPGAAWCEIAEERDFFDWDEPVDWIVGNPPFSIMRPWLNHSFKFASDIVYLLPIRNVLGPVGLLREIFEYGGMPHIRLYGGGSALGFPMGNAIGAMHFKRNYAGPNAWSWAGV